MKIGYIHDHYPEKTNIIGKVENCDYVKTHNYKYKLAKFKWLAEAYPFNMSSEEFFFIDFNLNHVDILHFVTHGVWPKLLVWARRHG